MPHSNPDLRHRLKRGLKARGGRVSAATRDELKDKVGMADVSNTQFDRALGSLHVRKVISVRRPNLDGRGHMEQSRSYYVVYNQ